MAEALIFHYRPDNNLLTALNPNSKLTALLAYTAIVSSAKPIEALILALIPTVIAIMIRIPIRKYLKESIFFIILAAVLGVSTYCAERNELSAASATVSFLAMVLSAILLTDTTMPDELSRSLGSALSHVIGKYAYMLATIMEITLAMIPIIIDSSITIFEARKSRGDRILRHPLKSITELAISILSNLLDKAEIYTDALYSRGYDVSKHRTCLPYKIRDWIIIVLSFSALIASVLIS